MKKEKRENNRLQIDENELQQIAGGVFSMPDSNMLSGFGAASFNAALMMSGIMKSEKEDKTK